MLLCAAELLERSPTTDRAQIRDHLSGNYCRCTGYHAIVNEVAEVAARRMSAAGSGASEPD
jgi:carbon-monoxide dehydrogenase small subunit